MGLMAHPSLKSAGQRLDAGARKLNWSSLS